MENYGSDVTSSSQCLKTDVCGKMCREDPCWVPALFVALLP